METLYNVHVIICNEPYIITSDKQIISDYYKFRPMKKKFKKSNINDARFIESCTYIPCENNIYHATIYSALHLALLKHDSLVLSNSCNVFDFYAKHYNIAVQSVHGVYFVKTLNYYPQGNPRFTDPDWFNVTAFNAFLNSTKLLLSSVKNNCQLLYIKRTSIYRAIQNSSTFESMLESKGFQCCIMESYGLQDQINMFHNARFIIGVHGAGLTNIIYCKPTCTILELKHKSMNFFKIHNCYAQLATHAKLQNYSQYYTQHALRKHCKSKDYNLVVDVNALSIHIDNLLKSM